MVFPLLSSSFLAASPLARLVVQVNHQHANMATLKEIQMRLKSISNIGKITKSMKMIASTKMARAQRGMEAARVFGSCAASLPENIGIPMINGGETKQADRTVFVAVSSDRGLCGGIHSSVTKNIKRSLNNTNKQPDQIKLVSLGDKCKVQLAREYRDLFQSSYSQLGKSVPTFLEASLIAEDILKDLESPHEIKIVYNKFLSVIAYESRQMPVVSVDQLKSAPKLSIYETEGDVMNHLHQFLFVTSLHWAMNEGHAAEFSARRSAMDNATKNAGDMVDRLTLLYNRQRQASITNDLVDIITGASAL